MPYSLKESFLAARDALVAKSPSSWGPVFEHIGDTSELIAEILSHEIEFCWGRHASEDFGNPAPHLGGASHDVRCVNSIKNVACVHHTRLYRLIEVARIAVGMDKTLDQYSRLVGSVGGEVWEEDLDDRGRNVNDYWRETYRALEHAIHRNGRPEDMRYFQLHWGMLQRGEAIETASALEISEKLPEFLPN